MAFEMNGIAPGLPVAQSPSLSPGVSGASAAAFGGQLFNTGTFDAFKTFKASDPALSAGKPQGGAPTPAATPANAAPAKPGAQEIDLPLDDTRSTNELIKRAMFITKERAGTPAGQFLTKNFEVFKQAMASSDPSVKMAAIAAMWGATALEFGANALPKALRQEPGKPQGTGIGNAWTAAIAQGLVAKGGSNLEALKTLLALPVMQAALRGPNAPVAGQGLAKLGLSFDAPAPVASPVVPPAAAGPTTISPAPNPTPAAPIPTTGNIPLPTPGPNGTGLGVPGPVA